MSARVDMFGVVSTLDGDRDCWATPSGLFAALNRRFGFGLDVCALPWSAKCAKFYTPEIDGLRQDWFKDAGEGAAWCNPPFSDIEPWLIKARDEADRGLTTVCILPAHRVEQPWWQRYVEGCAVCGALHLTHVMAGGDHEYEPIAEVVSIPGRVNYVPPPGIKSSGAEFPSCLAIYWGR